MSNEEMSSVTSNRDVPSDLDKVNNEQDFYATEESESDSGDISNDSQFGRESELDDEEPDFEDVNEVAVDDTDEDESSNPPDTFSGNILNRLRLLWLAERSSDLQISSDSDSDTDVCDEEDNDDKTFASCRNDVVGNGASGVIGKGGLYIGRSFTGSKISFVSTKTGARYEANFLSAGYFIT